MNKLIVFALVGFFAQLVDGALGMGFGLTSSTILLAYGLAPAVASASIHMAQVATTAASGFSHYKFGNVDKRLVVILAVPGAISAFLGAAVLSWVPGEIIRPYISLFLLVLGIYIIIRFLTMGQKRPQEKRPFKKSFLFPLGFIGGFLDAVGGGGWGPVNTPVLLARQKLEPRKVIGTVDTSEFIVTVSATLGFLIFLGWEQFSWLLVSAFVIGGVIAAPLAAWLVKIMPSLVLGVLAGGFIVLTNIRTLLNTVELGDTSIAIIYTALVLAYICMVLLSIRRNFRLKPATR
ncbi:sulfite exporter TauE/SafE family protein [Bacillus sp. SB49]|uniref:sulfite exporter TauE/SafE family protein n=1 Tax=Bacillaceae TaxID=186817 RepID=UPI00041B1D4F|nr:MULTISPECIES: sulfite exporter TauE/SafE family protein [Bacillaceae]QHT46609.1 sulfite exporter TauE/SafE family protein [Bacillus sp. SB49]